MDTIIIVVVVCALVSLVVLMFRYAGFIHQGPSPSKRNEGQKKDETDNSSTKNNE